MCGESEELVGMETLVKEVSEAIWQVVRDGGRDV